MAVYWVGHTPSDKQMMTDLQNENFVSKELSSYCVQGWLSKQCSWRKPADTIKWHISRKNHCDTFEALCVIVDENFLEYKEIRLSSDLNYQYNILLTEIGGQENSGITHITERLEEKLRKWYKGKIKIEKGKTMRGNVIFSSAMSYEKLSEKSILWSTRPQVT